jgi:hypothetical protein
LSLLFAAIFNEKNNTSTRNLHLNLSMENNLWKQ